LFASFFICLEQIAVLFVYFLIAEMKKILSAGFIWKGDGDLLEGFAWCKCIKPLNVFWMIE